MQTVDVSPKILTWLLDGDVAIQHQVYRDVLGQPRPDLQARIALEGWGQQFLAARHPKGYWGQGFYQPKWISTHYTLLDLRNLELAPNQPPIHAAIEHILRHHRGEDGGVNPARTSRKSDVCVNGMFLNYAAYFQTPSGALEPIVDFLIATQMPDGGFNCQSNQSGAVHSSLHSTISVLEGIQTYLEQGYAYRSPQLAAIAEQGREFLLQHRLFRSDKTGKIISARFLMLSYPSRWFYDILRALDHLRRANVRADARVDDALAILRDKRRKDGTWTVQARHAGQTHFEMEQIGKPSRWNTLRALRVLSHFG